MGDIEVVDRGSREFVAFLRGDIDESLAKDLDVALGEVAALEDVDIQRVLVDLRDVTAMTEPGVKFLVELERLGRRSGFEVALSMVSKPALRALESAHWPHLPLQSGA
jgi:anti-anti-sigma regulatory factor